MELQEIKRQLSIGQVLQHYGLKPDKHDRLLCPFHLDRTPSLQVYPKTCKVVILSAKFIKVPKKGVLRCLFHKFRA